MEKKTLIYGKTEKIAIGHSTLKGNSASFFFLSIKEFLSCHHFQSLEGRWEKRDMAVKTDLEEVLVSSSLSIKAAAILDYFVTKYQLVTV